MAKSSSDGEYEDSLLLYALYRRLRARKRNESKFRCAEFTLNEENLVATVPLMGKFTHTARSPVGTQRYPHPRGSNATLCEQNVDFQAFSKVQETRERCRSPENEATEETNRGASLY